MAERSPKPPKEEWRERVYEIARLIPRGKVTTYGELAALAGLPRGARRAGKALRELPPRSGVPWWRVINAQGRISLRPSGMEEQARRLRKEGVAVSEDGKIDLKRYRWEP